MHRARAAAEGGLGRSRCGRAHYFHNELATTSVPLSVPESWSQQLINRLNDTVFYILMFTQLSSDNVAGYRNDSATGAHIN